MEFLFKNGRDIKASGFSSLSDIEKQQLLFSLLPPDTDLQKIIKNDLDKALKKEFRKQEVEICEFWQVVDESKPDKIIYDVWIWNVDTGCVFISGTTEFTKISMIQYYFGAEIPSPGEAMEELSEALNIAFKQKKKLRLEVSHCLFNDKDEITGFVTPNDIPADIKQWNYLFKGNKVSESLIRTYQHQMNKTSWQLVGSQSVLSEDLIREFAKKVNWTVISQFQTLSEAFIREFQDKVGWSMISYKQKLSESFIREFQDKVDWGYISCNQEMSEEFIREFKYKVDWQGISWSQKLSLDFIREFEEDLNWQALCSFQILSETFIREFEHKISWYDISISQKLSLDFIREFEEQCNWFGLSVNPHLSEELIQAFPDKIEWYNMVVFNPKNAVVFITEERILSLRKDYPQQQYWKEFFRHTPHISKEFKTTFLNSLT